VRGSHNGTAENLEANYSWLGRRLQASYLKPEKHYSASQRTWIVLKNQKLKL
jgi:hypothetical protein